MSFTIRKTTMLALLTMALFGFAKVSAQTGTSGMTGKWSIEWRRDGRVRLQLQSSAKGLASVSSHVALAQFQGLTEAQLAASADVRFQLVREAGTFTFSGSFGGGSGTGQWTFNAAPVFLAVLRQHGYEQPTNQQLFALASSDVRGSYIAELEREGYQKIPHSEVVALYSNGVDREFIERMKNHGQKNLTVERLLSLRTNGF